MRLIADSQITNAVSIEATNVKSFAGTEKLLTYQLVDKMECTSGTTQIIIDFGSDAPAVSGVALCGTNISTGATVSLGYSATDPSLPELTIPLPVFTTFNQVWFLDAALSRRFWIIDITDPDPQDSSGVEIGRIQLGEYTQLDGRVFPSEPSLSLLDSPSISATNQGYGSKGTSYDSLSITVETDGAGVAALFDILRDKQRIEPILWVPFEDSLSNALYPPRFGVNTADTYPYPVNGVFDLFQINLNLAERF